MNTALSFVPPAASIRPEDHVALARFNQRRLRPAPQGHHWREALAEEYRMRGLEGEFVERERDAVVRRAGAAPDRPDDFVTWFETLREHGPGQGDPLFPWLAETATREQLRWFVTQEVAGEAGFDDLVAMTQVRLPPVAKLEMARNYWDEMGRGTLKGMHGPMLTRTSRALAVDPAVENVTWQSLALANLMLALAANRRYAYHSVGALGAIEMTAPTRVGFVKEGLKRVGVPPEARQYFAVHATLDVRHSEAWNRDVLTTLVAEDSAAAQAIAEGALMRLSAGARCFARYRREFGLA